MPRLALMRLALMRLAPRRSASMRSASARTAPRRLAPTEVGHGEVGLEEVGHGEVGLEEAGHGEVGFDEVRDSLARLPTPIPFRDPFLSCPEQSQRLVTVHGNDLPRDRRSPGLSRRRGPGDKAPEHDHARGVGAARFHRANGSTTNFPRGARPDPRRAPRQAAPLGWPRVCIAATPRIDSRHRAPLAAEDRATHGRSSLPPRSGS